MIQAAPTSNIHEFLVKELSQQNLEVKLLKKTDLQKLQNLIDLCSDFFLTCEGKQGSAEEILKGSPPSKSLAKDKFVIGLYEGKFLIGFIDLIRNYPDEGIWTIGYLVIHPNHRCLGKGGSFVAGLEQGLQRLEARKLRCIVQSQNPHAFQFWKRCKFKLVETINTKQGTRLNHISILEKPLK